MSISSGASSPIPGSSGVAGVFGRLPALPGLGNGLALGSAHSQKSREKGISDPR